MKLLLGRVWRSDFGGAWGNFMLNQVSESKNLEKDRCGPVEGMGRVFTFK